MLMLVLVSWQAVERAMVTEATLAMETARVLGSVVAVEVGG